MFAIGGAAVALGFIRIHSSRALNTGIEMSNNVGEMMIIASLGMSLAAIAHNLPSMRVFWNHVSKSLSPAKHASQRLCQVKARDKLQDSTTYDPKSVDYGDGNFSRPYVRTMSTTNLVDRPLPALPNTAATPRYPLVNDDFGSRPRTPPYIA